MTIREIVTIPNPVLHRQARKVKTFSSGLQYLISDMVETMRSGNGVGLAAPQIGISQQIIVVEYIHEDESIQNASQRPKLYAVINPTLFYPSSKSITDVEACLSIPGFAGEVERYQSVSIRGLNRHGRPLRLKVSGWLARIFQHEIDHIHGVLYTDRATKIWRIGDTSEETSTPETNL